MQIKIYVPTHNLNIVYDYAEMLEKLTFGSTIYPNCKGRWRNPLTGKVEVDNITVIEAFTDREDVSFDFEVGAICANLRDKLKQQCIMYTINDKFYFV